MRIQAIVQDLHFNPRPPWGGRLYLYYTYIEKKVFQSTPSVGRATPDLPRERTSQKISIHALRGEGDDNWNLGFSTAIISIHALRGEGDFIASPTVPATMAFQSTPSVGRATYSKSNSTSNNGISIHALRGEGDNHRA